MRKRTIYRLGAYILTAQMIFSNSLPCYASEIGSGAYPVESGAVIGSGAYPVESAAPIGSGAYPAAGTVTEQPPASVITSVSVSPGTMIVSKNSSYAFVASVTGRNNYSNEVTWSVSGQTSQNTYIDGNGILHVGSDEASSSLIVKAVSKQDGSYSATALATVQTSSYSIQVKASPDNGGTVSGGGTVKEGGYAVITAIPNNGYTFEGWLLNNNKVSSDSQYTVGNIHSDGVYIADFKAVECRINVNVNNNNAGTATESKTVRYGENVTLEAWAKDGYQFDGWMENGVTVSTGSRLQLDHITGSRNLTAMFSQNKYSLSLTGWPASTGTVSGQGTYDRGSDIKIKAVPISGYRFVSWSENGNIISNDAEYTVNGISRDMFLVATFDKAKTYSITAQVSSPNGKIVPEGKSVVSEGSEISYVVIPQEGYAVNTLYIDGKAMGAISSYSFSDVKGDHTISADFVANPGQENDSAKTEKKEEEKDKINKEDDKVTSDEKEEDTQTEETDELTGTLERLGVSVQEAERMIEEHQDAELLMGVMETGDLKVEVYNDFIGAMGEASGSSLEEVAGVKSLKAMVDDLLTKEEKIEILQGKDSVLITLSIANTDGKELQSTVEFLEENKLPGITIGHYFDLWLSKSVNNEEQYIRELSQELKIRINIPEDLKGDNREFYILRRYTKEDGTQDFAQLLDEDDDPNTITFSTDKISPCAIAYIDWSSQKTEDEDVTDDTVKDNGVVYVVAIMAVAIAAVVTFFLLWYISRRKKR